MSFYRGQRNITCSTLYSPRSLSHIPSSSTPIAQSGAVALFSAADRSRLISLGDFLFDLLCLIRQVTATVAVALALLVPCRLRISYRYFGKDSHVKLWIWDDKKIRGLQFQVLTDRAYAYLPTLVCYNTANYCYILPPLLMCQVHA